MCNIRRYEPRDEGAWLRCRALSFLDTAYFDDVWTSKPSYENPSLEVVAEKGGHLAGLIEVEKEVEPGTVCSKRSGPRAMIWSIGVLPEYRRQGIGRALVAAAVQWAQDEALAYLEAWTRDDAWVQAWYEALGFQQFDSYWHVYLKDDAAERTFPSKHPALRPKAVFAHLLEAPAVLGTAKPDRIHQCCGYELQVSSLR